MFTVELEPPVPDVEVLSPTEVAVSWTPIEGGVRVRSYKIQYRDISPLISSRLWETVSGTDPNNFNYRITKLTPGKLGFVCEYFGDWSFDT